MDDLRCLSVSQLRETFVNQIHKGMLDSGYRITAKTKNTPRNSTGVGKTSLDSVEKR